MEYKFGGKVKLEDYIKFNMHANKSIFSKNFNIVFYLIIIGIIVYNILPAISNIIKLDSDELIILIKQPRFIFYIIILLSIPFIFKLIDIIYKYFMGHYYKKFYDSNKLMTEYEEYNISENNIHITNENESVKLTRDKILKIEFDNDSIYVFIGLNAAYIIKKHFFEDENMYNEIKIFIIENYIK